MELFKFRNILVVSALALGVTGCASDGKYSSGKSGKSTHAASVSDRSRFYGENVSADQERRLQATDTIYFGFDRYDISDENRQVLYAHAKKMLENPELTLRIEGHADRRGSREYNLALGERRANAAKQVLRLKGVPESRLRVVSYGKEKPADLGSTDSAFAKNRRDRLVYEN